jgi:hypothetical protein
VKALRFLAVPALLLSTIASHAGLVLSEIDLLNDRVEIVNTGTTTENLTGHWLCNLWKGSPNYIQITTGMIVTAQSSVTTLSIPAGGVITLQATAAFVTNAQGEIGLYTVNNFADSNSMVDYVCWGGDSTGRDTVAAAKGIWGSGTFVTVAGITAGQTIQLKVGEDGNSFTDYQLAASTLGVNQVVPPVADPVITSVFRNGSGDLVITFTPGGAGFILTSSNDLATPFAEETNAIYDPLGTFTVPVAFLNPGRDFFRVVKP